MRGHTLDFFFFLKERGEESEKFSVALCFSEKTTEETNTKKNSATYSFMILRSRRANTASTATLGAALRLARCKALPFALVALFPGPTPRSESASAQRADCSLCAARTLTRSLTPP